MVDEVNNAIIQEFPEDACMTYLSVDEIDASTPEEKALWPLDFWHSLTPTVAMAPTSWKARVYGAVFLSFVFCARNKASGPV